MSSTQHESAMSFARLYLADVIDELRAGNQPALTESERRLLIEDITEFVRAWRPAGLAKVAAAGACSEYWLP